MPASRKVTLHDRREGLVGQPPHAQSIEQRRETRDRRSDEHAIVAQHPDRFRERLASTVAVEVVQRTQQQDDVGAAVGRGQAACVAETGRERLCCARGCLFGLLHVPRYGVDQVDGVAVGRQPGCVRAAADVEDPSGRRWQHATQDLLGTFELHTPTCTAEQPAAFVRRRHNAPARQGPAARSGVTVPPTTPSAIAHPRTTR